MSFLAVSKIFLVQNLSAKIDGSVTNIDQLEERQSGYTSDELPPGGEWEFPKNGGYPNNTLDGLPSGYVKIAIENHH